MSDYTSGFNSYDRTQSFPPLGNKSSEWWRGYYDAMQESERRHAPGRPPAKTQDQNPIKKPSALDTQIGGDHYKKLGDYQPWEVLRRWLTPEEFRGFMKGTAIAYLAREKDKGGTQDIEKAMHTLAGFIDLEAKP